MNFLREFLVRLLLEPARNRGDCQRTGSLWNIKVLDGVVCERRGKKSGQIATGPSYCKA